MLKVCVLASTSKGNATFIRVDNDRFLIDAGLSVRKITKALKEIGERIEDLNGGVLITHEHEDHITCVKTLSQKFHLKFWLTFPTYQKIKKKVGNIDAEFIDVGEEFIVGEGVRITPYEINHDAVDPVAYLVKSSNGIPLFGCVNDCGRVNPFLIDGFREVKVLQVEANHSFDLLLKSSYPDYLKKRILGSEGHLSNWDCAKFITMTNPKIAILSHISENNNSPETAVAEVETVLSHYNSQLMSFIVVAPYNNRSIVIKTLD
ncbi:MAG: MBL fold metallo-hydrolase [Candidatus Hodarchaeales archaeon]|jgi:phosphoribosyl 1,2-cyclic phosphodiesterase